MKTVSFTQSQVRHPGLLAWLRLVRVFQKVERISADHFRKHELSSAQFDLIAQVGSREGMSQQELAESLLVTKGNVCQLLDRMEGCGLVERRPNGRLNRLYLTARGRQVFEDSVPAQERLIAQLFGGLSPQEQTELLHLLRKVERGLPEQP